MTRTTRPSTTVQREAFAQVLHGVNAEDADDAEDERDEGRVESGPELRGNRLYGAPAHEDVLGHDAASVAERVGDPDHSPDEPDRRDHPH